MTENVLKAVAQAMSSMNIRYGFMEYSVKPVEYPYFIGEYSESASVTEDGLHECQFQLTGYSRTTWKALEECKKKISAYFDSVSGRTMISEGNGIAVYYENALVIPTWDEELKKIQINLHVKEWSV